MNFKHILSTIGLISVIGCAPSIKIYTKYQDPAYSFGQIKKEESIKVIVDAKVNLSEYHKTFQREYLNEQGFTAVLQMQIADSLKARIGCIVNGTADQENVSVAVSSQYDNVNIDKLQQLLGLTSEDYILLVTSVGITKDVNYSPGMMMANPGGMGMQMGSGQRVEKCIVSLNAELWNVKNKRKVLAYSSTGEAKVTMLFFGTALKGAVANSIKYMIKYLRTGVTT